MFPGGRRLSANGGRGRWPARKRPSFERQAAARPAAVALSWEQGRLRYGELNRRATQLADWLRGAGVGLETLVGICLERGPDLVVALLGVLKAGGAYVPLEPSYPAERLAWMLEDAGAALLLTSADLAGRAPRFAGRTVVLEEWAGEIAGRPERNPAPLAGPSHLAYVIYTSGSTGSLIQYRMSLKRQADEPGADPCVWSKPARARGCSRCYRRGAWTPSGWALRGFPEY